MSSDAESNSFTMAAFGRPQELLVELGTRLLIIDDDETLCNLLREYLERLGYRVDLAHNGIDGLERALTGAYGAILIDVMMPGKNGLEVLTEIRRRLQTPVLMLTALGEEGDRIAGLEMGADDYLPKTFSTREILARIRAVLRRSVIAGNQQEPKPAARPISIGKLWIDPDSRAAAMDDKPLDLTTSEYDILWSLARSAGRVKTREQLLVEVAERDFEVFDRSIDMHISSLRKKLGDNPRSPTFVQTVRGVGYLLRKPGTELPE